MDHRPALDYARGGIDIDQFCEATRKWLESGRHVTVEGRRIFVVEAGDSVGAEAVLFIHGFPTSCHDWRFVMAALADRCRCIAFDLIGFGLSDKPAAFSYSLFQQADMIEALCAQLGLTAVHVVSHDVGTSIHTELLARIGEGRLGFAIKTSTFLNGSIIKSMAALTPFQQMLEPPSRVREAMEFCNRMAPLYVDGLKRLMVHPEVIDDTDAVVMRELLEYQEGHRRIPAIYCYVRERYLHMDRWVGALAETTHPLQIVWATGDPVAVEAMGDALAARVPQARYVKVPDTGHFIPVEAPDTVAEHVWSVVEAQRR